MPHSSFWALPPDAVESILSDLGRELAAHFHLQPTARALGENDDNPPLYTVREGVALIPVSGVIDRVARVSWFTGQAYTAGQDVIRASVDRALADAAVRGLLFSLNSPGGVVAGTKELADYITEAATRKPCAAYADGQCASAAYWLASATGRVYAPQTASVGSVGVIAVLTDWSQASEKYGVVRHIITGGKWKAAGHPDKPLTDAERAYFQTQITELHAIFRADVAAGMGITADPAHWGEGQLLLAEPARQLGLVTAIVRDADAAMTDFAQRLQSLTPHHTFGTLSAKTATSKEKSMNKDDFKAQHPDLYAAVLAEGKAEAEAAHAASCAEETLTASRAADRETLLGLVKAVAGEDVAVRVGELASAGITTEQLAALGPLFPAAAKAEQTPDRGDPEKEAREKALAVIGQATGSPLSGGADGQNNHKSALVADAERRAAAFGQQGV